MAARKDTADVRTSHREAAGARIPMSVRLKAWWDGYDVRLRNKGKGGRARGHSVRAPESKPPWDDDRIGLVQAVWGPGFDRPGGEEFVVELVKPCGLDPSMSVLEVGAGLGGATRAISKAFALWMTGLESDENLADVANELSRIAGLGKKAPIRHANLNDLQLERRGYNCVFAMESFFRVPDKQGLLDTINEALKPGGQLLFTDYVLGGREDSEALRAWRDDERTRVALWSVDEYRSSMSDLKLDIPITEDITARTAAMIKRCWAEYLAQAQSSGKLAKLGALVLDEAEIWTRRLRALESGDLKVFRFHALKKPDGRMLADW